MKLRSLPFLFLLTLGLALPAVASAAEDDVQPARWTVMVYIAADNNLEPNSVINLLEMAAIGSTPEVNIVAQITRPPGYNGFYGEWGGTRRFLVTKGDTAGLSSGDFKISPSRFAAYVEQLAAQGGLTEEDAASIKRAPSAQKEKAALAMSVPVIETATPLAAPQLKSVEDLGAEVNSASTAALTDFGQWTVENYPAEHYGLVLWDHGGGWSMIAADDTHAPNGIKMTELQKALDAITHATGKKLDFIGFDACLMAQLPVAMAVKPYANYSIAAEELVPGFGWDYTAGLRALVANPQLTAPDFGKAVVDGFHTLYSTTEKEAAETYDMGVLDLSKVDGVVTALGAFDAAVKASNGEVKAIATARENAQQFAQLGESADMTASIASVDLADFMRLVDSLSKNAGVKKAATDVTGAVSKVVLYHKASKSLPHARGLSIFFPSDADTFASADGERYRQEFAGMLPAWQSFMDRFYGTATETSHASKLELKITEVSTTPENPGSLHDTPVISYSLEGTNVVDLTANVVYQLNATTHVVIDQFPVTSNITTEDGSEVDEFPDGKSDNDFYWNSKLPELSDGKQSLLVLMTYNPKDEQHGFIRGTYTNRQSGKANQAYLLIDVDSYESAGLWVTQGTSTVAQVEPRPGDTFEPAYVILDEKGEASLVGSGTVLKFHSKPMQLTNVAGPDGKYSIVLHAEDAAGHDAVAVAEVDIKNDGLDLTLQGFKDLGFGISFLYPFEWTDVQRYDRQDGSAELYVNDEDEEVTLSAINVEKVTSLEDVEAAVEGELDRVQATAGHTADVTVGEDKGRSTAYTFTDEDGVHYTGKIVAVYIAETKQGYLLKIEAPTEQAEAAEKVFDQVLESSQFFVPVE